MSKLRIAITADTYPYASDVTNLVRAPFTHADLWILLTSWARYPLCCRMFRALKAKIMQRCLTR